jgi:hypothetical protein
MDDVAEIRGRLLTMLGRAIPDGAALDGATLDGATLDGAALDGALDDAVAKPFTNPQLRPGS